MLKGVQPQTTIPMIIDDEIVVERDVYCIGAVPDADGQFWAVFTAGPPRTVTTAEDHSPETGHNQCEHASQLSSTDDRAKL